MRFLWGLLFYVIALPLSFSLENTFYVLHHRKQEALSALASHYRQVNIIIPQTYIIDGKGNVSGILDNDIAVFAKKYRITLLPMVTNSSFDPQKIHQFLTNPTAQKLAIATLIRVCQQNQVQGIQFDFEMVPLVDKKNLTAFYQQAAEAFHQNKMLISFSLAPTLMDANFPTAYQKKLYSVWQGAYDFKKLGEISDFVTIMAYDQHAEGTIPGPIASAPWVEKVIQHALLFIPADKISLGIPTYSGLWFMSAMPKSDRIIMRYNHLDYETLQYITKKYQPQILWDKLNKIHFAFYDAAGLNKYIFIEDAASFATKRQLAIKYKLRGISLFRLGVEDPAIWKVIAST